MVEMHNYTSAQAHVICYTKMNPDRNSGLEVIMICHNGLIVRWDTPMGDVANR